MTCAFDPFTVKGIRFRNRILRSATHEGMTSGGDPDRRLVSLYERLCEGGVGGIITGYAAVSREGMAPTDNMLMFDDDSHTDGFRTLAERTGDLGVPTILQLVHCGRQTREAVTGLPTVAPSAIRDRLYNETVPRELTGAEIGRIVEDFVSAAERAERAGFPGIQIHAAHGYLLSSFLSPHMNRRRDEWGGSTGNRFRIVRMICKGIRSRIGDYPVFIKINCFERSADGIGTDEAVRVARLCQDAGFDAIEVSCGIMEEGLVTCRGTLPYRTMARNNFRMKGYPRAVRALAGAYITRRMGSPPPLTMYNVDAAAEIQRNVDIPVAVVGGIRSAEDVRSILDEGRCAMVSMSRPFITEPDVVRRLMEGGRSGCTDCNRCLIMAEGNPLRCYSSASSGR